MVELDGTSDLGPGEHAGDVIDRYKLMQEIGVGATATGRPYFAMELVRGVPITEYCDRNKLGIAMRLDLFAKVCDAIQHAHHKGECRAAIVAK